MYGQFFGTLPREVPTQIFLFGCLYFFVTYLINLSFAAERKVARHRQLEDQLEQVDGEQLTYACTERVQYDNLQSCKWMITFARQYQGLQGKFWRLPVDMVHIPNTSASAEVKSSSVGTSLHNHMQKF
jgi:hypothetical protein